MAEHFVGPVMEKLIDACFEYFKDQVIWQTGMKEELEELRVNHNKIKAVLSVYSQTEIKDQALNKWYWQLRDAIDEADNVLDELEYRKIEKSIKKRSVGFFPRIFKSDPTLKRLEEAVQKLSKISAEVGTFQNLLDHANQEQQQQQLELNENREEGSIPTNQLLGRSMEIEFLSQWLRNPSQTEITNTTDFYKNISLLSLVGHGGMGKTALLQHVYSDGKMEGFDVKMWACVSNNFKPKIVIKNILESLTKKMSNSKTLEALQSTLKSKVTSKRFLLVLDDIWEADETKWKKVLAPLHYGNPGSRILITTRMNSVASTFARMIKNNKMQKLEGLEKDKCLQLFNTHAFAGVENPDDEFKSIAVKMVERLSGCPLAAKVIGGILNSHVDKSYWTKVLNTNIGNIKSDQNHLLPVLKLSYIYLPKFLQNCFTFCSIFPQDYEFDKDDLIRMWISLGFIQSSNISGETDLEDTGRRYFNILVQKSFFDKFYRFYGRVYYKMHDILHELAQCVSSEECLRVVDDRACSIPKTIRYLSIDISSSLEAAFKMMGEFKNLRSLILSFSKVAKFDEKVISEILKAWNCIRLLVINVPKQQDIPDTIDCLIHLRYLKVQFYSFSMAFKLPRSISHLYHLQFINFPKLQNLENLENLEMNNTGLNVLKTNENCQFITHILVIKDPCVLLMEPVRSITSLLILEIEDNGELVSFTTETEMFLQDSSSLYELKFQKLQSLQSLPSSLERLSSLGVLQVYNVPQLKLLSNPPASLVTLELHNLESLQCLPSSLSTISSLMELILKNIPLLMSLPSLPSSLKMVTLEELESLQCLPSSLSTISSLLLLELKNIPLKLLPDLPSSLEMVTLEDLESLQCLPSSLSTISSLKDLTLRNIPLLKSLPDLPSSLATLILEELKLLQCMSSSLSTISSISYLELKNIPLLKSLPDLPSSLITFYLKDLESLQCLPSTLSTFSSLTGLILKNIPLLNSLPNLPSSLETLALEELESLQCLPSSLSTISSISYIELKNIPLLKSLPDLPSSLATLILEKLESLQCLPSSLSTISSISYLELKNILPLKSLPDLPSSLATLILEELQLLLCLPSSLSTISSLSHFELKNIPLLKSLPNLPSSLKGLRIEELESLQCLPSSLSTISSILYLELKNIPLLQSLPDFPSSLATLILEELKSLQCLPSSLSTMSSLLHFELKNTPILKSLPNLPSSLKGLRIEELESLQCLPSSLSTISFLSHLVLKNIPLLKSLPNLPSSLKGLGIEELESLQFQPSSFSTISSLSHLKLKNIQLLKSLPDLSSSLQYLVLENLENLDCLPSCLPTLRELCINEVPRLRELPDLPTSLECLSIADCHPQLMDRYENFDIRVDSSESS